MGRVSEVFKDFLNIFSSKPEYEVSGNESLSVVMSKAGLTAEDVSTLEKAAEESEENGQALDKSQKSSVILQASDMVIMAGSNLEKKLKESKVNKKLSSILASKMPKEGALPKDYMVTKAEEPNGKLNIPSATELENSPREPGGRSRDERYKR